MKIGKRLTIAGAVIGLVCFGAIRPQVARADGVAPGEIEASTLYCLVGPAPCFGPSNLQNLRYAEAAAVFLNGQTTGKPDGLVLVCGRDYFDSQGHHHQASMHAFPGPASAGFDGGTIYGIASMNGPYTEASTRATSSMTVSGYDPIFQDMGYATGYMITDNATDSAIVGGMQISLIGRILDEDLVNHNVTYSQGSMSCRTNVPNQINQDSEAVVSQSDGD